MAATPGQLARRAEFYYQLAQLTAAGVGLIPALQQLHHNPPSGSYRRPIEQLLKHLESGMPFADALQMLGRWLPEFDISLTRAAEQSGRLDQCFRLLAEYYSDRARMARQVINDLMYPVFILHFAVFIFPFPAFFNSGFRDWLPYVMKTCGVLLPIYVATGLLVFAMQSRHSERWRAVIEKILHPLPVLGSARRSLAVARLAAALEALISAGVNLIEAWPLAASASGSPALRKAVLNWTPKVRAGMTPGEAVNLAEEFPKLFANQYRTGEVSGQLDDTLRRMHRYYQEEGSRKLHVVSQWVPRFIYLAIAIGIAFKIINFYTSYFDQIRGAGGF